MSSPTYTLAELLAGENPDAIVSRLLSTFQGAGFPAITEWQPKDGVEMGFVEMVGRSEADLLADDIPAIVAGGFLGKARGLWMDLKAEGDYRLPRNQATKTTFNMDLVVAETADPTTWNPGDVEIVAPTGNRYRSTTGGTGQPGSFATLAFEAAAAGAAYNDSPDAMTLVTTFAGVTLRPSAPPISSVIQGGGSTGQIQVLAASTPEDGSYVVRIDVSGDVNGARYSLQKNGGEWVSKGVVVRSRVVGFGLLVVAYNGSGSPSSFVAGDTFTFAVPGGPDYDQGSDTETEEQISARCRGRWSSLSRNATDGLYELWAVQACPTASRVQVAPDLPTDPAGVPGRVKLYCADARGPLDGPGIAKITSYVTPKLGVLDSFQALGATPLPISVTGDVLVTPTTLVAVQQAAEIAWAAYLASVPLGGSVLLSKLVEILMDAGAVDVQPFSQLILNDSLSNVDLAVGEVPVESGTLIESLDWVY